MTFALYYASKTHMKITRVQMLSESDAREWFGKVQQWIDVIRLRMLNETTGEVVQDLTMESRMVDDGNPVREEQMRELVERMDRVFVADREVKRREPSPAAPARQVTVSTTADDRCRCGHTRIEHGGSDSSGRCTAPNCAMRCQRFWKKA